MVFAYGFGGLRDYDGILAFYPRRAPEDNGGFAISLTYRGRVLDVEIGINTVIYTLREGDDLVIHHDYSVRPRLICAEEVRLTREQPTAIRQVSRW